MRTTNDDLIYIRSQLETNEDLLTDEQYEAEIALYQKELLRRNKELRFQ
jgi:hypothetical protein